MFFRLWGTQTADTGWDPTDTYLSQKDGSSNPIWPKAPADDHTIPFFATSQQPNFSDPNDPEFKAGAAQARARTTRPSPSQQAIRQWAYFGCYLDVNDPGIVVNGTPIWQAFPGTHHCLVAEIAFCGHADRNRQRRGRRARKAAGRWRSATCKSRPRTIRDPLPRTGFPQTFASSRAGRPPSTGWLAGRPDELMIFWGDTPVGSTAQIYWPAVSADEVISLADWMYGVHPLTRRRPAHDRDDDDRRRRPYVPIPGGPGGGLCGPVQHRPAADGHDGPGIQHRRAPHQQTAASGRSAAAASTARGPRSRSCGQGAAASD